MRPNRVLVRKVASYDDSELLDVVRELLRIDETIVSWLQEGVAERLIVIKPNWIQEAHEYQPDVWEPVITHPRLIAAIVTAVAELTRGRGTICICDAPHSYASFDAILQRGDLPELLNRIRRSYPELQIQTLDLRREVWVRREEVIVQRIRNAPDPRGYVPYDLGKDSLFFGHRGNGSYYGADYDSAVVNQHHSGDVHEYLLAGTPVVADLFINVPKLKTHKKTGLTCCLKNLVGINGDKNWLPHHTEGTPRSGGDEFPDETLATYVEREMKRILRSAALTFPGLGTWIYRKTRNAGKRLLGDSEKTIRNGNWSGNDTCWRMALDLNRALLFGNTDGSFRASGPKRRYLTIVDAIVGGDGSGPLCPEPVRAGLLLGGTDPAAVDAVACRVMGFDPAEIPIVREAFADHPLPIANSELDDVEVDDQRVGSRVGVADVASVPGGFRPHFGWKHLALGRGGIRAA